MLLNNLYRLVNLSSRWTLTIILFVITANLISCKKYLDEKSDKSLVELKTLDDLQGLLNDEYIMNTFSPAFGESSADDFFLLPSVYNELDIINQQAYSWTLTNYSYINDWAYSYNAVYNSNYCLEQIERAQKNTQNENKWNTVKGSALFFRSYYFLQLAWVYAKAYDENTAQNELGIVLRLGSDFNKPSVRATIRETYNQILNDLKIANEYLPDLPEHPNNPSRAANYALLARAYLSMRKYDSAYKYADLSLQLESRLLDYNDASISRFSTVPFSPFNKEILFYTTMSSSTTIKSPSKASIDTLLYDQYDNNDLRKAIFFRPFNGKQRFKGSYASGTTTLFTGIAIDETYLIRAECNARLGKVNEAMNDLNALLEKRWANGTFVPVSATSQERAIEMILKERRKELLMRGLRWADIKRLNKEGANITPKRIIGSQIYTLSPNDNKYALPIPKDIIDQTGIPQN